MRGHLRAELERAPAGDIRLISLCAGQGRDVAGALSGHPRRHDVRARLAELDGRNVALARQAAQAAQAAGLDGVGVLQAGAGITGAFAGPDGFMPVGAHRLAGEPATLALGQRLFTFPGGTQLGPS